MNDKNISRRGVIRPTKIIFEAAARHFSNCFLNESIHSSILYGGLLPSFTSISNKSKQINKVIHSLKLSVNIFSDYLMGNEANLFKFS